MHVCWSVCTSVCMCVGRTALSVHVTEGQTDLDHTCVSVGLLCVCMFVGRSDTCVCMCVDRSALCVHVCRTVNTSVYMCVGQTDFCAHACWSHSLVCACAGQSVLCVHVWWSVCHVCQSVCLVCACVLTGLHFVYMCISRSDLDRTHMSVGLHKCVHVCRY